MHPERKLESVLSQIELSDRQLALAARAMVAEAGWRNAVPAIVDKLLIDAFTSRGLKPDHEPNDYGLRIQEWIDQLNAIRIKWPPE